MAQKTDVVFNFEKYLDQRVRVKFQGGREGKLIFFVFSFYVSKCNAWFQ